MFSRNILLGLLILLAQSASAQQNFSEVGMFFVGGELVDGEMRGQGLVHFIKPEDAQSLRQAGAFFCGRQKAARLISANQFTDRQKNPPSPA